MTGIGIGIGLGFNPRGGMSPGLLHNQLSGFGTLVGLWITQDAVMSEATPASIATIPGRVGGTATSSGSAAFTVEYRGSRLFAVSPNSGSRYFAIPTLTWRTAVHYAVPAALPFANFGALIRERNGRIITESNSGTSNLRTPGNSWLPYVDGAQTAAVTLGSRVFAAGGATPVTTQADLYGMFNGPYPWVGSMSVTALYSEALDSTAHAGVAALLRQYHGE